MTQGLNKVMLIGHLGRDPEMRFTPSGKSVTTFPLAINRSWTSADGEKNTDTEWFNVVAWGNLAEICKQNLCKGQLAYIERRLQTRRWEDSEGNKHKNIEIIAEKMLKLGSKYQDGKQSGDDFKDEMEEEYPF